MADGWHAPSRASSWSRQTATLKGHVPAVVSPSHPVSPSRQRWGTAALPSPPGRWLALVRRHGARPPGRAGAPARTDDLGPQGEGAGGGAAGRGAAGGPGVPAGAPAEIAAVALLPPVDRPVAAGDAAARIDVALGARELPARESERGARRVPRRDAVAFLARIDG